MRSQWNVEFSACVLMHVYEAVCKSVHTSARTCEPDYACIAAGCMYACQSAYLLTNQTYGTCACIEALVLVLPKIHFTHIQTHTGWHLGWHLHWQQGTVVWYSHKEAWSCNPDPVLMGLCVCLCVIKRPSGCL